MRVLDPDSNHHSFHPSTQYYMAARLKTLESVTVGGKALSSAWHPLCKLKWVHFLSFLFFGMGQL